MLAVLGLDGSPNELGPCKETDTERQKDDKCSLKLTWYIYTLLLKRIICRQMHKYKQIYKYTSSS